MEQTRYEQIVLAHLDAAYNLARWLTRNDQDAEDVVQQACLRALGSGIDFQGGDRRACLLAIVRSVCHTRLGQYRDTEWISSYGEERRDVDRQRLQRALESLPVEFREVIVLREMEGFSYREIALIAGISSKMVMSRLAQARSCLLECLRETEPQGVGN